MKHKIKTMWMILPALLLLIPIAAISVSDDNQPIPDITPPAVDMNLAGESIHWKVLGGGYMNGSSENVSIRGTAGQTATGYGSSESYGVHLGFWSELEMPCDCIPGDANGDLVYNILDITYLIAYLYTQGPEPTPYAVCSGDPNADCTVNILDITYLIGSIYQMMAPPVDCETWRLFCGEILYSSENFDTQTIEND